MLSFARLFVLCGLLLCGCGTAREVAVSSFRILDAPANFVRRQIDPDAAVTTTSVETRTTSDVVTPGRPVAPSPAPTSASTKPRAITQARANPSPASSRTPRTSATTPPARSRPSASPRVTSQSPKQFPTARPVPGRPGYVYSLDPSGGIVDVTGYKSGDKAKDPYTQQVFIVP